MWIVSRDPFLMKKLLKSGIYKTHKQCTYILFTVDKINYYGLKKKKRKKHRGKMQRHFHCNPNGHIIQKTVSYWQIWHLFLANEEKNNNSTYSMTVNIDFDWLYINRDIGKLEKKCEVWSIYIVLKHKAYAPK